MNAPIVTGSDAAGAAVALLTVYPALKREPGNGRIAYKPAPGPTRGPRLCGDVIRQLVAEGRLEWINECHSAVRLRREA